MRAPMTIWTRPNNSTTMRRVVSEAPGPLREVLRLSVRTFADPASEPAAGSSVTTVRSTWFMVITSPCHRASGEAGPSETPPGCAPATAALQ